MIPLLIYAVSSFGFAYVAGHSVISRPAREVIAVWSPWIVDLIECPMCLGFWTGLASGLMLALTSAIPEAWQIPAVLAPPVLAFFTSGCNFMLGRVTGLVVSPQQE